MDWPAKYGAAVSSVVVTLTSADVDSGTVSLLWFELTPSTVAVAVFVTFAFDTSVAVTMYDAVQVIEFGDATGLPLYVALTLAVLGCEPLAALIGPTMQVMM